eukprot:TRINITY_DN36742_c0_g1_i1.p3 TRINITY_DN36742_c0_g1~~TRINITY_DN36742_c0_g1_i1.p3  ORF type:complete len:149 (-),score=25.51 TRINITY_DN36742_c0_g1_i1:73-519(-)
MIQLGVVGQCLLSLCDVIYMCFFFLMIRRPPRSTHCISSAASDVYKRQVPGQAQRQKYKSLSEQTEEVFNSTFVIYSCFQLSSMLDTSLEILDTLDKSMTPSTSDVMVQAIVVRQQMPQGLRHFPIYNDFQGRTSKFEEKQNKISEKP